MSSASLWMPLISSIVYLAMTSGFWVGLIGLWRSSRGASWWLMAIGMFFNTIGPILYALAMWQAFSSLGSRGGISGGSGTSAPWMVLAGVTVFLIPVGILLCSIGFGMHGMKMARRNERIGELEQLSAAMNEEIDRLRQGGPIR